MRHVRNLLYFVVGVLLSAVVVLSHAETIDATPASTYNATYAKVYQPPWGGWFSDAQALCDEMPSHSGFTHPPYTFDGGNYCASADGAPFSVYLYDRFDYTCPNGGFLVGTTCNVPASCPDSTWSLSGNTCTRPDCPAGQSRDPLTGQCIAQCPNYSGTDKDDQPADKPSTCTCPAGSKWYPYNGCRPTCAYGAGEVMNAHFPYFIAGSDTKTALNTAQSGTCAGGCQANLHGSTYDIAKGGILAEMESSGYACKSATVVNPSPTEPQAPTSGLDPATKHPPTCAQGEGVITSSSGNVMCLPAGIPNTSTPIVEKKKTVEQYPDGTQKATETTTTKDPNTGASDVQTTSTATAKTDGTAGMAGIPGTTSTGTNSGGVDGNGDGAGDGSCDPTLNFCGGPGVDGLYTKGEKTVQGVMQTFADGLAASPVGQATHGFLNVTEQGGSCPAWSVTVDYLQTTLDIGQYFCNATALQWLDIMGMVVLAVVSFVAFKWAIL